MYKDDPILIHGNKRGLITDGNIFPIDSVFDCSNMDFFPDYDRRREPYSMKYDGSEFLPAGYSIVGFHEYRFTNEDGSQKEVIMVAGKDKNDPESPLRIWTNDFYEPGENYHNGISATDNIGWLSDNNQSQWTELTEMIGIHYSPSPTSNWVIDYTANTITTAGGGIYQTFTFTGFTGEKAAIENYCRGWYAYAMDSNDEFYVVGIVTYQESGDNPEIVVRCNATFEATTPPITGEHIVYQEYTENQEIFLSRFPVTVDNINNWINITDVSFTDNANAVQIACGENSRVLNLSFLQNKEFFGDSLDLGSGNNCYKKNFSGLWFAFDSLCVKKKKNFYIEKTDNITYTITQVARIPGIAGIGVTNNVKLKLDVGNIFTETNLREGTEITVSGTFGGCDLGANIPSGTKTIIRIYESILGNANIIEVTGTGTMAGTNISFQVLTSGTNTIAIAGNTSATDRFAQSELSEAGLMMRFRTEGITSAAKGWDEIWDCCMQLSGFQSLFVKRAIGKGDSANARIDMRIDLYFNFHYDRRFTEIEMFYGREMPPADLKVNYEEKFAYLLSDKYYGRTKHNDSGRYITYNDSFYYLYLNPYSKTVGTEFELNATVDSGISTDSYLNNRIWKDPFVSTKEIIQVGKYSVAVGIQREQIDSEKVLNGKFKISVSNLQQGAIETSNCFPDERDRQISTSQPLTKGVGTIGNQFLIFSERTMYACDLLDGKDGTISQSPGYEFAGTYGRKTLVKAKILDQFAGLYYLSNDTIYRYLSSGPEDILLNRWKETYQAIPEDDKRNAISGYNPFTKDVFFVINETVYIWNIIYENWRKYTLYDLPEYMISSISGQIYWSSGQNIYALEKRGTAYYRDQTSDDTHSKIPFMIRKRMLHGTVLKEKIPDRVGLIFESESINDDDEYIEVSAGRNGATNDILDSHYINIINDPNRPDDPQEYKYSLNFGKGGESIRARAKFYDLTISYVDNPGLPGSLKQFKIKEYLINAKI